MKNNSKNNRILAWLTFGDGYHNNHHRYPRSAFHGMFKHETDLNGLIILALRKVGLARNILFADGYLGDKSPVLPPEARSEGAVDAKYPPATGATASN
jgi:hypothetical protein